MKKNLLLLLITTLAILFLIELTFRIYYVYFEHENYEQLLIKLKQNTEGESKEIYKWSDLLIPSTNKYCFYENIADFSGKVKHSSTIVEVRHNADGLRAERDYPLEKEGVFKRIVVFGDSGIYGWGNGYEETYSRILESLLNERYKGKYRFEAINFGVPGYQSIQTIEMFFYKGKKYSPDIVIVGTYGLQDLDFATFFYPKYSFWQKTSFLWFYFSQYFDKEYYSNTLRKRIDSKKWATNYGYGKRNKDAYPEYHEWIGFENAKKHFIKLKHYCVKNKIYLLDVFPYFGNNWARTGAQGGFDTPDKELTDPFMRIKRTKELGVTTVDAFLLAEKYFKEKYPDKSIDVFASTELCPPNDCHPGGIINRLLAGATIERMIKDGIIPEN